MRIFHFALAPQIIGTILYTPKHVSNFQNSISIVFDVYNFFLKYLMIRRTVLNRVLSLGYFDFYDEILCGYPYFLLLCCCNFYFYH